MLKTWKDGQRKPCSPEEFAAGLRRYAEYAKQEFGVLSSPSAHLSERLEAAADQLDLLNSAIRRYLSHQLSHQDGYRVLRAALNGDGQCELPK